MQMRMRVLLQNGHKFTGRWTDCTQEQFDDTKQQMAGFMPDLNKIELTLENGDELLIPKTAAQNSVLFLQKRD